MYLIARYIRNPASFRGPEHAMGQIRPLIMGCSDRLTSVQMHQLIHYIELMLYENSPNRSE